MPVVVAYEEEGARSNAFVAYLIADCLQPKIFSDRNDRIRMDHIGRGFNKQVAQAYAPLPSPYRLPTRRLNLAVPKLSSR